MQRTSKKFAAVIALGLISATSTAKIPFFQAFPRLEKRVPHISLGTFPTPVQKLEALSKLLEAPNLYIKRDGLSGTLFGGNKIRKLEFILAHALKSGATGVGTMGFAGSNHTCATAVYANQVGLECHCFHLPQTPTRYLWRNLLLSSYYGAHLHLYPSIGTRDLDMHKQSHAHAQETGVPLYFIPSGGSNLIGSLGFVNAAFELKEQIEEGLLPEPDFIYVPCGSVGTAAGLLLGIKAAGLKSRLVPICIEPDKTEMEHEKKLAILFNDMVETLQREDFSFPEFELTEEDLIIDHDFIGEGYAIVSNEARDAIAILDKAETIKLDGTYSGKTFAALLHDLEAKNRRGDVILFWDTFCSGKFADITSLVDYKDLPTMYQPYFEMELQDNDQGV